MKVSIFFASMSLCGLLLAGCGGGGGQSDLTIINGVSVPREPDVILNNSTISGIDSNSNGVRDDVERQIALAGKVGFDVNLSIAKEYQKILVDDVGDMAKITEKYNSVACLVEKKINSGINDDLDSDSIVKFLLNNEIRRSKYYLLTGKIRGKFIFYEKNCK